MPVCHEGTTIMVVPIMVSIQLYKCIDTTYRKYTKKISKYDLNFSYAEHVGLLLLHTYAGIMDCITCNIPEEQHKQTQQYQALHYHYCTVNLGEFAGS